jgi:hypothetical protein
VDAGEGIGDYVRQIRAMHESGEDASDCLPMTHTAGDEAGKLREWPFEPTPTTWRARSGVWTGCFGP